MRRAALAPLIAVLAAAGLPSAPARAAQPLRLTIAFTGDVIGYLEPCG